MTAPTLATEPGPSHRFIGPRFIGNTDTGCHPLGGGA
jgi:hypothetical protein